MYKNAVKYGEVWLAPGSKAFDLYHESRKNPSKQKELDIHLKEVARREQK